MDMARGHIDTTHTDDPFVAEYDGVCGGYPVIGKMRFPVRVVVEAHRQLGDVEKIAERYPQLTRAQIRYALDYYAANPRRVDEDFERNAAVYREYVKASSLPWPV